MTKVRRNVRSTRQEVMQDLALSTKIISRVIDILETESFHHNRHIVPLLALAYEQTRKPSYGWRTKVASTFGYSDYEHYARAIAKLS